MCLRYSLSFCWTYGLTTVRGVRWRSTCTIAYALPLLSRVSVRPFLLLPFPIANSGLVDVYCRFLMGSVSRWLCLAGDSASYPSFVVWTLPIYFIPELSAGPYFLGRDILDRILFLRSCTFLGQLYTSVMGAGGAYTQRRRFCQRFAAFWCSPWLLSYAFEFWFHLGIS